MEIRSKEGGLRATLTELPDGIEVRFWARSGDPIHDGMWRQVSIATYDMPWHVVCDQVHRVLGGE